MTNWRLFLCVAAVVGIGFFDGGVASADVWVEVGDAGQLPGTAQVPQGSGPLTSIMGAYTSGNVDMFLIHIANPAAFSAQTSGATDPQLFLFNSSGFGVQGNDDAGPGLQAQLGPFVGPPGNYFLAISGYDDDPTSPGGLIFPDFPFGPIYGPTGPGGGQAITGWTGFGFYDEEYTIILQGATFVPEPASIAVWSLLGLVVGLTYVLRQRKGKAA